MEWKEVPPKENHLGESRGQESLLQLGTINVVLEVAEGEVIVKKKGGSSQDKCNESSD